MKRSKSRGGLGQNNCCDQFLTPTLAPKLHPHLTSLHRPIPTLQCTYMYHNNPCHQDLERLDWETASVCPCWYEQGMLVKVFQGPRSLFCQTCYPLLAPAPALVWQACTPQTRIGFQLSSWAKNTHKLGFSVLRTNRDLEIRRPVLITQDSFLGPGTCRVLMVFPTPRNATVPLLPADSKFKPQMPRWHRLTK